MSLKVEGKICPVCKAYMFDEEEIVYCPTCGAPHHKECYNHLGHCGLENLHGTPQQYDSSKENAVDENKQNTESKEINPNICENCNRELEEDSRVCPYCGTPRKIKFLINVDLLGGVNKDEDIGDGVKADTAKDFIGPNSMRYVPKFASLKNGKKVSWNWAAFLLPEGWFFYRKMYKAGLLILSLITASELFLFPLQQVLDSVVLQTTNDYAIYLLQNISKIGVAPFIMAVLGTVIRTAICVICGIFGDYIYKSHAISEIKSARNTENDSDSPLKKRGGANPLLFLLGIIVSTYLPSILFSFIA